MPENSEDAKLRIMAARIIAQMRWPYISSVLFNLRLVETNSPELPTMAVDAGWRLYYSPEFVMKESPESLATVLIHECMHCLMSHNERFVNFAENERNPFLWNVCADCAINQILDDAKMPWTDSITPVRYADYEDTGMNSTQITETAYALLMKWVEENKSSSDFRFTPEDCGSVANGIPRTYELDRRHGEAPSMDIEQQKSSLDRVAGAVLYGSTDRGDIPAGLLRWAEEHLDPQVNWRKQLGVSLRRAVASIAGRRDYSYMRPSRRQEAMRLIGSSVLLPSLRQPAPPRVSIVVDTSGSIGDDDLRKFIGEIAGIVKAVGFMGGVKVIPCDAIAYAPQTFRNSNQLGNLTLQGGGGTDMREGIQAAVEARQKPDVIVVVTDGFTPWPASKPLNCEHFIVVLTSDSASHEVPDWMRTVVIN
jgi:predicted metal-dependent peptidase